MSLRFHPEHFWGALHSVLAGHNVTHLNQLNHANAVMQFFTDTQPASVVDSKTALGAVQLGSLNFSPTSFSSPSDGVSRLLSPITFNATATGTVTWARIFARYYPSGDRSFIDLPVSSASGGSGAVVDDISFVSGQPVNLEKMAFYIPETMGTVSLSLALRNGLLNTFINAVQTDAEVKIGDSSTLSVYSGALPASVYTPMPGVKLAEFTSANEYTEMWEIASANGEAVLSTENSWNVSTTVAAGIPSCFRLVRGALIIQGTCSTTGGDINVDKSSVGVGESLTIVEASLLVP